MNRRSLTLFLALPLLFVFGCQSAYYGTMEQFGVHKRDILVDRVEDGKESQEEARETFANALEQFRSVVNVEGGDLEDLYDRLNDQLEDSEARADEVRDRIDSIRSVAEDLFAEWEDELDEYTRDDFRRASARQLRETRDQYEALIGAMERASARMDPVLAAFNDQVLFLKHNLNARAVASLQPELDAIADDVATLIEEMNAAIAEADAFISGMGAQVEG